jgi:hypothetical protein
MESNNSSASSAVTVEHVDKSVYCSVVLKAQELSEFKLGVGDVSHHQIKTPNGDLYSDGLVKILCGSGLASARRSLGLKAGLKIQMDTIAGNVPKELETGICVAVAVAIAKQLSRYDAIANILQADWKELEELERH